MIYINVPGHYRLKTDAHKKWRSTPFPGIEFLGWAVVGVLSTGALLLWWYN